MIRPLLLLCGSILALVVATAGPVAAAEPTTAPGPSASESPASTTTTPPTPPLAPLPPTQEEAVHGGSAWAVYLAAATDISAPEIADAVALMEDLGYVTGWGTGDLACDRGGARALGISSSDNRAVVGAYFDSVLDAARFVVALDARGHSVLGLGLVQTYCLD